MRQLCSSKSGQPRQSEAEEAKTRRLDERYHPRLEALENAGRFALNLGAQLGNSPGGANRAAMYIAILTHSLGPSQ
jgi:hypothetical protein